MTISGHNYNDNTTVLCAFILGMNEKKYTFDEVFKILKIKYKFNPNYIMCDFRISQIKAVKYNFPRSNIHCCFFHYSQALWKHFMKYGLGGKNTYLDNSELLFNLQLLCFIDIENIEDFYKKIVKTYKENKYKNFFNYSKKTWLGKTIPKKLWNFSDILDDEKNFDQFSFTNNASENINRYLNRNLKKARCSSIVSRPNALDIILQFNNKIKNDSNSQKHKSEILKFYV